VLEINLGKIPRFSLIPRSFSSEVPCPDRVICVEGENNSRKKNMEFHFLKQLLMCAEGSPNMGLNALLPEFHEKAGTKLHLCPYNDFFELIDYLVDTRYHSWEVGCKNSR
jgi:hypothetical protein